ncbi:Long-chain-fatty-acid--CoA ligase [Chondromyces apiculatus DSM 436]|uniref:Long-chain-fatty-acid--CoA ligase n=1 Tax=Chondromyces apiculatus DSM 436 TaxID=1192034 RepID=A0A017T597_9BACT|nr:Long-chain-fatty-acid--CoA ligase [Chondromyces apiculatus DSM 436]
MGPDVLVGLYVERSEDMIVAVLAILKSGGAYVPLDPAYPSERLRFFIEDSGVRIVVTHRGLAATLPYAGLTVLDLQEEEALLATQPDEDPARTVTPEHAAYVIYTSGSTGKPKGVVIPHGALGNYTQAAIEGHGSRAGDRVLQFASINFDASALEIYPCLADGRTLVLRDDRMLESIPTFLARCEQLGVTVLSLPAAYWHEIAGSLDRPGVRLPPSVRLVLATGEMILPARLAAWRERFGEWPRLLNGYGPTETTIVVSMADITAPAAPPGDEARESIPAGLPIRGARACILDPALQPVDAGAVGELYLGGAGLARGYLRRPQLTATRFIPDPFHGGGERLYRTGDLARFLRDGSLEILGRADNQVKLRGFRIELGEIESVLCEHPGVLHAVAVVREDPPGDRRLVAYVVKKAAKTSGASGASSAAETGAHARAPSAQAAGTIVTGESVKQDADELRAFLRNKLPHYMIPSHVVLLDAMPMTQSGKLDRGALPAPARRLAEEEGEVPPQSAVAQGLASIFAAVLGLDRVGLSDSFLELGGHSLLAMQVVARIRGAYQVELPLRRLFETPTVAALAGVVEAALQGGAERPADPAASEVGASEAEASEVGALQAGAPEAAITRVPRGQRIPLSCAQQRLWFVDQMTPGHAFYNLPESVRRIVGPLNVPALERALAEIVRRHEVLRTTFDTDQGEPVQRIQPHLRLPLPVADLRGFAPEVQQWMARTILAEDIRQPFDLREGPLARVRLLQLDEEEHLLVLVVHHIVCDGWSLGVLFTELGILHEAFASGLPSPLPELPIQVADHAVWQRRWLQNAACASQLAYWRRKLDGLTTLELPTDHPRPSVPTYRGGSHPVRLPEELTARLRRLGQEEGVTLFMTLLAAYQVLLARYSVAEDIPVGVAAASRTHREQEALIGFFVNTLIVRGDLSGNPSFRALLRRVRGVALEAYAHQDLPFDHLVNELQPERNPSRHPLFQVGFTYYPEAPAASASSELRFLPVDAHNGTSKLDLLLMLAETPEGVHGTLEYSTDLYEHDTAKNMVTHFLTLMDALTREPSGDIWTARLLPRSEEMIRLQARGTEASTRRACEGVHALFAQQVALSPEATAVTFEGTTLTYAELDRRSNQTAHHLIARGAGPGSRVGLCMERSPDLLVAILAVLKAGAAYVPLDPAYPEERRAFMMQDARVQLLLTQQPLLGAMAGHGAEVLCVDADLDAAGQCPTTPPGWRATAEDLAYVIYTSGSTGKPKGVMVTHGGVCNLAEAQRKLFDIGPQSRVLQFASASFDASVWEILMALTAGATLCLARQDALLPGPGLLDLLDAQKIDTITLSPSILAALPYRDLPSLRTIIVAGEACSAQLAATWGRGRRFFNAYGPTESTVCATVCATAGACAAGGRKPPIGKPIDGARVYLLDRHLASLPALVPGEIYLGGTGIARGYLARPALTAERFLPDPFSPIPGSRMYRTGDRGRALASGDLDFLGRIDRQVKVRGVRIEVGELEAVLGQHPRVTSATVVVREDAAGQKKLVAYVTTSTPEEEAAASQQRLVDAPPRSEPSGALIRELRRFLQDRLPSTMVPSSFVWLDALPLSPTGKVNVDALPSPEESRVIETTYVAPRTEMERAVARTFCDVLQVESVGAHDNFFDLGGSSLQTTQVQTSLRQSLGVRIAIIDLFKHPTVSALAQLIRQVLMEQETVPRSAPGSGLRTRAEPPDRIAQQQARLQARRATRGPV